MMKVDKIAETGAEQELWNRINDLGFFIWKVNHDLADGRIDSRPDIEHALLEAQEKIQFAVDQTTRFGVKVPRNDEGGPTAEYWLWFHSAKTRYQRDP